MIDRSAAARAIEDFLRALGHEPTGELERTGERVVEAWADDLIRGESVDVRALLQAGSFEREGEGDRRGLIVLRDLAVATMCPHHLMPAHGVGLVAYMPGRRIAGIGAIAGVLEAFSRRLTLQETIGEEVVSALVHELGARGALCKLTLTHTCLIARNLRRMGSLMETIAVAGSFAEATADRDLAFAALGSEGRPHRDSC